jgi:hypothetical protein
MHTLSKKFDFSIYGYANFTGYLKKVIQPKGYVRFCLNFFSSLVGCTNNSQSTEFLYRPLFEIVFTLKLKAPKISFGTATIEQLKLFLKWQYKVHFEEN